MVALDSTKNLLNKIQTKKATFKLDKPTRIKSDQLNSLKIVSISDNNITVSYEKNRIKIEEIINLIQNEGIEILDISTDDADLEDVFLELIKN